MKYLGSISIFLFKISCLVFGVLSSTLFSLTLYGVYFTHSEGKANFELGMLYYNQFYVFDFIVILIPGLITSLLLVVFVIKDFRRSK